MSAINIDFITFAALIHKTMNYKLFYYNFIVGDISHENQLQPVTKFTPPFLNILILSCSVIFLYLLLTLLFETLLFFVIRRTRNDEFRMKQSCIFLQSVVVDITSLRIHLKIN